MRFRPILVVLCLLGIQQTVFAASFDCAQSSTALEKSICADPQLSKADEEMAKHFFKLKESLNPKQSEELLNEQKSWLKRRADKCAAGDVSCLQRFYSERIDALRSKYENIVPFVLDDPTALQGLRGICAFTDVKLPENTVVYATGAYSGRKIDYQIDQSGHQATQFDVVVNSVNRPTVLILGAYEPSIWNIGWTKDTKIIAVVASGYHRQAVAGLPKNTPLLISSHDNQGPCGYLYISQNTLAQVNPLSKRIFDRTVDMVYMANGGRIVVGSPVSPGEQLFTSTDVTPDSFIDKNKPLAGPAGIRDAVAKGLLRAATNEDAELWASRKAKSLPKDTLPPVSGGNARQTLNGPRGHNVFVILKPFRFPSGLYGGNLATFYVAEGVPYPEGDPGHSGVYDFNTMTCRGALCGAR